MSGNIDVDLAGIKDQLNTFSYLIGDLEAALKGFPTTADAGSASQELAAVVGAVKARSEHIVAVETGLSDLVIDVANDLLAGDEDAADKFKKVEEINFDD